MIFNTPVKTLGQSWLPCRHTWIESLKDNQSIIPYITFHNFSFNNSIALHHTLIIFCKQINPSLITDPYEYQVSMGRWWCFAMNIQCLQILSSLIYCYHTVISLLYCHHMIVISINFSTTLLMFWNVEGLGVDEEEQIGHSQQREEN